MTQALNYNRSTWETLAYTVLDALRLEAEADASERPMAKEPPAVSLLYRVHHRHQDLTSALRQLVEIGDRHQQILARTLLFLHPDALAQGRTQRADTVVALLLARELRVTDLETGKPVKIKAEVLAEAVLRDAFWDQIEASVEEEGLVARLQVGAHSPSVKLLDGRDVSFQVWR